MKKKLKSIRQGDVSIKSRDLKPVVKALKAIEAKQTVVTPRAVVEAARPKFSPLHRYFEWSDTKAARLYREVQAGRLIRAVSVTFIGDDNKECTVRAFVNVRPSEDEADVIGEQGYISAERSAKSVGYKQQVLEYAKQQLVVWRKKFGSYAEFYSVAKAIDEL